MGSKGSVEPMDLKIRDLASVDFVRLHYRLWVWNPWILRVYQLGTHKHEYLTKPLQLGANETLEKIVLILAGTWLAWVQLQPKIFLNADIAPTDFNES